MKTYLILGLASLFMTACSPATRKETSDVNEDMKRILVVVEKGTNSLGFYTEYGKRIKSVKLDTFPHEMAISSDRKKAYVTNNGSLRYREEVEGGETISIIKLETMEKEGEILITPYKRPHGICIDPVSGLIAVSVENPDKILMIDPDSENIVDVFDNHGDTPHMITISQGAKTLYIANVLSDELVIKNTETKEHKTIPVGSRPQEMEFFDAKNLLFVGCADYTSVIDLDTDQEIYRIPLGANRMELASNDSLLLLSSSNKGVGFVNTHTFKILYHLDLGYQPFSLNVSTDEKYAYLAAEEQNLIFIISIQEKKIVRKFKTPEGVRPGPVEDIWLRADDISTGPGKISLLPNFRKFTIDDSFNRGYQVKAADLNGDNKPDLVAVSDQNPEVFWYENPDWIKRLIYKADGINNIDLAPTDVDGDGDTDLALISQFDLRKPYQGGYVLWLENPDDMHRLWEDHFIDSITTSHRIRWADLTGDGAKELINLPIIGKEAYAPDYSVGAEFVVYIVPEFPKSRKWSRIPIDTSLHVAHGISILRWDSDIKSDILTASFEGLHLFQSFSDECCKFKKIHLASGDTSPRPSQGSSEVAKGSLSSPLKEFIASIEPWHGHQLVANYIDPDSPADHLWKKEIIDTTFSDGHALAVTDINYDGNDEIIAGHRGKEYCLYIYQYHPAEEKWQRADIDRGGISTAGICLFDFNDDGWVDIAACGSLTDNIVIYQNEGIVF